MRFSEVPWHLRHSTAWLVCGKLTLFGIVANASEPCRVEVGGPDGAAWQAAASVLAAELRAQRLPDPCKLVSLDAAGGRARLTFTLHDGRRAERMLDDPIELLPSVQALSAALPPSEPTASEPNGSAQASAKREARASPPPKPVAKPVPGQSSESPPQTAATTQNPYALAPVFGAHIGFRGGANRLITPLIGGSLALATAPWELGLLGRYEAHYIAANGENDGRPETSGLVLGVAFGFREAVGKVTLRGGGSLLLAALWEDGGAKDGRAEGRIGAYVSAVFPRESKLRFRTEFGPELVPYNLGRSEQNALGEWSLPWWALTFALGLEFG